MGRDEPAPILSRTTRKPFPHAFAWIGVGALIAFVVLIRTGYGSLSSSLSMGPTYMLGVYAAVLVTAIYCLLQALARVLEAARVPFRPGVFLFPSGLVDATRDSFRVFPLAELQRVESGAGRVTLHFGAARFRFRTPDGVSGEDIDRRIASAREELQKAETSGDARERGRLDPLAEPHFTNPLAPVAPRRAPIPTWRKLTPLFAILIGAPLAIGAGLVRNKWSEERMYAVARELNTVEAYQAYLARGGQRQDVSELLLPTSELSRLVARGTLEDLERYWQDNAESKIKPAIDIALRTSLLKALEETSNAGTVTALDEFARIHPGHVLVQPELDKQRKLVLDAALLRFLREHASEEEGLEPFMRGLLAFSSKHGPRVEVRFHRVVPATVARADEAVQRDKYFAKVMLPSQYFDGERSREREQALFEGLRTRFSNAFPKDILDLQLGSAIEPGQEPPETPELPTLFITHSTNMGGGIPNINPHGTFVGVGFLFKAEFVVPGRKQRLSMKYSTWRPPDLLKLRKHTITIPQIYLSMGDSAFAGFDERLAPWLFRE